MKFSMKAASALIAGGMTFALSFSAASAALTKDSVPSRPSWARADGTVDMAKMPSQVPVAGPDGKELRDKNGKTIMVPTVNVPPPPSSAPQSAAAAGATESNEIEIFSQLPEVEDQLR